MLFIIELLLKFRFMIVLLNLISFLTIYSLAGLHIFFCHSTKATHFLHRLSQYRLNNRVRFLTTDTLGGSMHYSKQYLFQIALWPDYWQFRPVTIDTLEVYTIKLDS